MKILEYLLWFDCPNKCNQCFCRNINRFSDKNSKINAIEYALKGIKSTNWDKDYNEIALVGGEIFSNLFSDNINSKLKELISTIIELIKQNKVKKLFLLTALLEKTDMLSWVIQQIKDNNLFNNISINTSWDLKYRFNENNRNIWKDNIQLLKDNNITYHIEMILSQFMIESVLENNDEVIDILKLDNIDLLRTELPINTDKNFVDDFFPKRDDFLSFIKILHKINKPLFNRLCDQESRAKTIHIIPFKQVRYRDYNNFIEDINKNNLSKCGHDKMYACYSDSDKCLICDIKRVQKLYEA